MSALKALKALVAERLAAAAEDILGAVERIITLAENKMLHNNPGMCEAAVVAPEMNRSTS